MRSREEIEGEMDDTVNRDDHGDVRYVDRLQRESIILEVLLDIRDLLAPKQRAKYPPSAPPPVIGKGQTP